MTRLQTLFGIGLLLAACARPPRLQPFTSDGCSLFPDQDYQSGQTWCDCCIVHDYAYWKGGPDSLRLEADQGLRACVLARTGDSTLAMAVFRGTRAGGSSYFPTWYRWGYGWPYRMKPIPDSVRREEVRKKGDVDLAAAKRKNCGD